MFKKSDIDLKVRFCGIDFENPFILSAAPPTDELEMVMEGFEAGWAGAILKTTSVGEEVSLAYPMITGLKFEGRRVAGLGNIDLISKYPIDEVEKRVSKLKDEFPTKIVGASIMGANKQEWQTLVQRLEDAGVDLIECSFSCPQGSMGKKPGAMLGQDVEASRLVTSWVKEAAKRVPVVIKITPQVADIVEVVRAIKEGGADGVCASNTIPSLMGIDLDSWTPNPNVDGFSTYSGLSGSAIKPITLRTISEIKKNIDIELTGTGGAITWKDAVEFILLGAKTVQFCTAVMRFGFSIIEDLISGVTNYLEEKGLRSIEEIVGRALPKIVSHPELKRMKVRSTIREESCIRCGDCVIACRDGGHIALSLSEGRLPVVDEERCAGCGLCLSVCPIEGAIEMKEVNHDRRRS